MNLNTTFVVSAFRAVAIRCCGAPCHQREPWWLARLGLPLRSLARLSLPHGVAFFLYKPPLDSRAKCNRALREPDLHVFAKLFEDCLKRSLEAQAFSGRQIGGDDDVLDFLVGQFVDVDLARQPAS